MGIVSARRLSRPALAVALAVAAAGLALGRAWSDWIPAAWGLSQAVWVVWVEVAVGFAPVWRSCLHSRATPREWVTATLPVVVVLGGLQWAAVHVDDPRTVVLAAFAAQYLHTAWCIPKVRAALAALPPDR
jgi:hypothetical protein